jgi:rod shape-determining protein MreC
MGMRAIILILISIALMVFDHRLHYFASVKNGLITFVTPLQYVVDKPAKYFGGMEANLSSRKELISQNAALRAEHLLLEAKLQRLLAIEKENVQLRALLASSPKSMNERVLVAQLLTVDTDPLISEVVLSKGKHDGVYIGQPVLDAKGIVGQIIEVGTFTSRVLLLTDPRSAIPVQDNRNGIRGIVVGQGHLAKLALTDIPLTVDIKTGDILVSSGLGGNYPEGYPVGVVSRVRYDTGEQFANIEVTPSAQLDRNQLALLIWPPKPLQVDVPKSVLPKGNVKKTRFSRKNDLP